MDIDNTEVIKFTNEVLRPLCEELRDLQYVIQNTLVTWHGSIKDNVTNVTTDDLIDNREFQGVSRLAGSDIHRVMVQAQNIQDVFEATGVQNTITKPCVRAFKTAG